MNIVKQMLGFLPAEILSAIHHINQNSLYEIRMRIGKPLMVRYGEEYLYLARYGLSYHKKDAIITTKADIDETMLVAGKYSLYSVEEQLRQGFLTTDKGVRIGISGHFILEKGEILTIRDFTSLCIRVPHEIIGAAEEIYSQFLKDELKSLLIASKPGQGKTTILRDLSRKLSEFSEKNILICDERGEIAEGDIGERTDVFSFANKRVALEHGIRAMRPDVIIVDELSMADFPSILRAKSSGVHIMASIHAGKLSEIPDEIRNEFDIVVLLDSVKIGKLFDFSMKTK